MSSIRSGHYTSVTTSLKHYPTIAACGLDCGLCPRFYTAGKSRCPGCAGPDFADKHPTCSFITCCVKKHGFETCGECPEFPCDKFKSPREYLAAEDPSYPPARKMLPNLHFIRKLGLARFIEQQKRRIRLLEAMLLGFDDGRSRSFYCRAAALQEPDAIETVLNEAKREIRTKPFPLHDAKARAKVLRGLLADRATHQRVTGP